MDCFGQSTKVEGQNELESIGIKFEPILFHPDLNEYELRVQLPGCPRNLVRLTYDKTSGELKLQGKKQKTEFAHQFPIPANCLATKIYGRFRGDVLHIIMPRLLSEWQASEAASSKQENDQKASYDPEATKQVGKDNEYEQLVVKSHRKEESKSGEEVAINAKIVTESEPKKESEEKKPSADGNETLGLVAKVKETGKAAVATVMKEENRLGVMIGAAVLALLVIGASLRSSSKKANN